MTFWTAGFDIIYSCQDYEFDAEAGLFSIPRRFGIAGALWIARVLHLAMIACLVALSSSFDLGWLSLAGIGAVVLLLLYEHSLVKRERPVARQRGLLHRERLRQRAILFVLGR